MGLQKDGRKPTHPDYDPRTIYIPDSAWGTFTPFEKQVRRSYCLFHYFISLTILVVLGGSSYYISVFYVLYLKVVSKIKQNHYDTVRYTKTHVQFSQLILLQKILFFQKGYDFEACTS